MDNYKFRGKRVCADEWIYGYLVDSNTGFLIVEKNINYSIGTYLVKEETIGRFIGITDKNNKSIFSGDIVKIFDEIIGEIVYHEPNAQFLIKLQDCEITYYEFQTLWENCGEIEIIGNIFDNKELLGDDL